MSPLNSVWHLACPIFLPRSIMIVLLAAAISIACDVQWHRFTDNKWSLIYKCRWKQLGWRQNWTSGMNSGRPMEFWETGSMKWTRARLQKKLGSLREILIFKISLSEPSFSGVKREKWRDYSYKWRLPREMTPFTASIPSGTENMSYLWKKIRLPPAS